MAYYGTYYSGGNAMTSSCLDGVPFKLGPKFLPPTKVFLPPELESDLNKPSRSSLLNEEYPFEVEEAVLKWSAERERQLEEQQRQAEERQASVRSSQDTDSSDSGTEQAEGITSTGNQPIYQNVSSDPNYENPGIFRPQPVPRNKIPKPINSVSNPTYVPVTVPNPLIANISNDILKPTPIQSSASNGQTVKRLESKENKKDFDMAWFEKEDDPFDNLELQTINDMEELASVLEETKKVSPIGAINSTSDINTEQTVENRTVETDTAVSDKELPLYENLESKQTQNTEQAEEVTFDIRKLPPIPPRRDLVGGCPLPPIGRKSIDSALDQVSMTSSSVSASQTYDNFSVSASFPKYENPKATILHKPAVTKPPRTFKYSRHNVEEDSEGTENSSNSDCNLYVQSRTTQSDPDLKSFVDHLSTDNQKVDNELKFVNCHFGSNLEQQNEESSPKPIPAPRKLPSPPSRPSSQQSWNRYNLLPPPGQTPSPSPDSYEHLTNEARTSVDNLVAMGFSKSRVIRAVEKLGDDQKEVVEYLCLVDQLTEKGFDLSLAESALLLFQNSMVQASKYLELFQQFQELGFSGDRIKEALINTQNDRERSLDILTAS